MLTDEEAIEVIAKRMEEECGWSKASTVMNHFGWIDVATHLFCEKNLKAALLLAYQAELEAAEAGGVLKDSYDDEVYREWKERQR